MIGVVILVGCLVVVLSNLNSIDLDKCKLTHKGTEYLGKAWKTETGVTCQNWSSVTNKGSKVISEEAFPDGSKALAMNYCRNPNRNPKGPWCYTFKKRQTSEICHVPLCKSSDCRLTGPGMEYAGPIEKSASGKRCTKWKDKHKLKALSKEITYRNRFFPDGSIEEAGRKCRNPNGDVSGPWCYVQSDGGFQEKELCDIPFCDDIGTLMYSGGYGSGRYSFFSSIAESQSLTVSFRLWDPSSWLGGTVYLLLSVYDIASERDDISRWNSGVEIKISNNGSGFLPQDGQLTKIPLILSGAHWTNLEIVWASYNQTLIVTVFEKPKPNPIVLRKIPKQNTAFEVDTFKYVSLGGSPALWNFSSIAEDCPVHTVTSANATRFWLIEKSVLEKKIELFIRSGKDAEIILRKAPMHDTNQVQVAFTEKKKIRVFVHNSKNQCVQLKEVFSGNVLSFWKWEYFRITLSKDKLQLFWVRDAQTVRLIEARHKSIETVLWVTFASSRVSYWTIYCDPRGISDPPPATPPECVFQEEGIFNGTLSVTKSGRQCIPWTDLKSLPEKYQNDDLFAPYGGKTVLGNLCRNLDNDAKGAYCIIKTRRTESGFGLERCSPRICSQTECKLAGTGSDYVGHQNVTRSKRTCKAWEEVQNDVVDLKNFPDNTIEDAGNFCRNPTKSAAGTWCFTTDNRVPRDVCYIKDCDKPPECTVLTAGYEFGTFLYILPLWRKYGLQFSLKAWNPDIYEGLVISLFSMDYTKEYRLVIGDEDNKKLKLLYKDAFSEYLLVHKTLPHLIPTGKWKGYWLRVTFGKVELGYEGVQTSFFEWSTTRKDFSFKPIFLGYGTTKNYWIGVSFKCSECLTTLTSNQRGYKIYPINLWNEETSTSKLRLHLRGTGSAFVTLLWTPDFRKVLALQIVSNSTNIFIVKFNHEIKKVLATFTVSSTMSAKEWSEFVISFTENTLTVHKGRNQLLEWVSPSPLLIYWFSVTAEGGAVSWTANCPPADIDGEPRDGSWGRWGAWSCSVTCGKGEGKVERKCDDPPPNVYGEECKGSGVYEGPCNDFPCGKISPETNNIIRQYLSTQHKSLQVDVAERVILPCNPHARSKIGSEVSEMNITWTHNGFPYSRTRFHMDENYSLVIPRAQDKHCGIYLCMAYQDPDSIPSKIVLEVISLVVITQKPTKKIRKGRSLTLKCNGMALSYVYADLSQHWELNGVVWKDYGLGTLQAFTVDKLENVTDSHAGVWTCVIIQEDFKFKWTTNWLYLKVKSAPSFWSHLMEDVATAPLFGKLGNERNAMILFFILTGIVAGILLLMIILMVKWLKK